MLGADQTESGLLLGAKMESLREQRGQGGWLPLLPQSGHAVSFVFQPLGVLFIQQNDHPVPLTCLALDCVLGCGHEHDLLPPSQAVSR